MHLDANFYCASLPHFQICYTTHHGLVFVTMAYIAHCLMLHGGQCVAMYIDGRIHDV